MLSEIEDDDNPEQEIDIAAEESAEAEAQAEPEAESDAALGSAMDTADGEHEKKDAIDSSAAPHGGPVLEERASAVARFVARKYVSKRSARERVPAKRLDKTYVM